MLRDFFGMFILKLLKLITIKVNTKTKKYFEKPVRNIETSIVKNDNNINNLFFIYNEIKLLEIDLTS
jgi:hypothetical protein